MWWLTMIAWASAPSWETLVTYDLDPVSARYTPDEFAEHLEAACAQGEARACRVAEGEALVDVVTEACDGGDRSSCVAVGWVEEADDPDAAADRYEALCDEGVMDACVDLGRAHERGEGRWFSLRRARQLYEPACAAGNARGCLMLARMERSSRPLAAERRAREVLEQGRSEALEVVVELVADPAKAAVWERACADGLGRYCRELAEQRRDDGWVPPEEPEEGEVASEEAAAPVATMTPEALLRRGCGLRDDESCVAAVLLGVEDGSMTRGAAQTRLGELCETVHQACVEERYLRYGGEVRAFKDGAEQPLHAAYVFNVAIPYFLDCYREALDRDPTFREEQISVYTWLDESGSTMAAAPFTSGDADYEACLAEAVVDRTFNAIEAAVQLEVPVHLDHEARFLVHGTRHVSATGPVLELEAYAQENWAREADDCYLIGDGSAFDKVFTMFRLRFRRDGTVEIRDVIEPTGIEEADRCVRALIEGYHLEEPIEYVERGTLWIRFAYVFRHPRVYGEGKGKGRDEETYMWGDDEVPPDFDLDPF